MVTNCLHANRTLANCLPLGFGCLPFSSAPSGRLASVLRAALAAFAAARAAAAFVTATAAAAAEAATAALEDASAGCTHSSSLLDCCHSHSSSCCGSRYCCFGGCICRVHSFIKPSGLLSQPQQQLLQKPPLLLWRMYLQGTLIHLDCCHVPGSMLPVNHQRPQAQGKAFGLMTGHPYLFLDAADA